MAQSSKSDKKVQKKPKATKSVTVAKAKNGKKSDANAVKLSFFEKIRTTIRGYLSRRPHRSFRMTRRRDYARSLKLPGYTRFTVQVAKELVKNKATFALLGTAFAIATILTVGISSQETYATLSSVLKDTGSEILEGDVGKVTEAGALLFGVMTGGISQELTEVQQIYTLLIGLFTWLTTVWLLRAYMAGKKVKLRDSIYNAGAPIIPTILVALVLLIQLLPLAFALIGYAAATSSGLLAGGVEAMLFWIAFALLVTLSLYWVTSTFIALVVVTLPGMYPFQALKAAGDLVIGRRLRLLYRMLWLIGTIAVGWIIVLLPVILIDLWIKSVWEAVAWVPLVPVTLLLLSTVTIIWSASYIYVLYRKVVDDDAAPA